MSILGRVPSVVRSSLSNPSGTMHPCGDKVVSSGTLSPKFLPIMNSYSSRFVNAVFQSSSRALAKTSRLLKLSAMHLHNKFHRCSSSWRASLRNDAEFAKMLSIIQPFWVTNSPYRRHRRPSKETNFLATRYPPAGLVDAFSIAFCKSL